MVGCKRWYGLHFFRTAGVVAAATAVGDTKVGAGVVLVLL